MSKAAVLSSVRQAISEMDKVTQQKRVAGRRVCVRVRRLRLKNRPPADAC